MTRDDRTGPAGRRQDPVAWCRSRFSGLFRDAGSVTLRAHDPRVAIWAGTVAHRPGRGDQDQDQVVEDLAVGGAGFSEREAEIAGIGEAIERWQTHRLPGDQVIRSSFAGWRESRPGADGVAAVPPERWVLFHAGQHALPGFPFEPLTAETELDWVGFRQVATGAPCWVPAELAFMDLRPGVAPPRFAPAISTGWSAHRSPDLALLRGVQEIIERDAVMGAWWGAYPLREYRAAEIWPALPRRVPDRVERRNLDFRFYHVSSPYSAHVTLVTVTGEDREGLCFSIGSACREERGASWQKALIEAIQGRHFVRYWLPRLAGSLDPGRAAPTSFREHALWYSLAPERLGDTALASAEPARSGRAASTRDDTVENLAALIARLGPERPALVRLMTPPALASSRLGWVVVRVMVPGLQPLHGDHRLPFLGGPAWGDRPVSSWAGIPPHPFA